MPNLLDKQLRIIHSMDGTQLRQQINRILISSLSKRSKELLVAECETRLDRLNNEDVLVVKSEF